MTAGGVQDGCSIGGSPQDFCRIRATDRRALIRQSILLYCDLGFNVKCMDMMKWKRTHVEKRSIDLLNEYMKNIVHLVVAYEVLIKPGSDDRILENGRILDNTQPFSHQIFCGILRTRAGKYFSFIFFFQLFQYFTICWIMVWLQQIFEVYCIASIVVIMKYIHFDIITQLITRFTYQI